MQIDRTRYQTAAFREELAEAGSVAGKNVTIEFRFAEQRLERVPALVINYEGGCDQTFGL